MTANIITLTRIALTFILIALFGKNRDIDIAAIATIPLIFGLDAVDGYIARKYKQTNALGAVLDIAADRIIENVFYIYFATHQIIHVWMPIAILTRGIITDTVRSFALKDGNAPFEMNTRTWARAITSSRISRLVSGASKMGACFAMAVSLTLKTHQIHTQTGHTTTQILATLAVAICIIRGIPVLIEGRKYVTATFLEQQ